MEKVVNIQAIEKYGINLKEILLNRKGALLILNSSKAKTIKKAIIIKDTYTWLIFSGKTNNIYKEIENILNIDINISNISIIEYSI